jgi:hypothetical protein
MRGKSFPLRESVRKRKIRISKSNPVLRYEYECGKFLPGLSAIVFGTEFVTDAAHGVDQAPLETVLDFAAQVVHIDIDDIGAGIEGKIPDMLDDHGTRDPPPSVQH